MPILLRQAYKEASLHKAASQDARPQPTRAMQCANRLFWFPHHRMRSGSTFPSENTSKSLCFLREQQPFRFRLFKLFVKPFLLLLQIRQAGKKFLHLFIRIF